MITYYTIFFIGVIGPIDLYHYYMYFYVLTSSMYMFHIHRVNLSSTLEIEFRQIDGCDGLIR